MATHNWVGRLRPLLRTGRVGKPAENFFRDPSLRGAAHWGWNNIIGIHYGWRSDKPCLTFMVRRKLSPDRLKAREFMPELLRQRELGWEIPTRVEEYRQQFELQMPFTGTLRPGMNVGHEHGLGPGTGGYLVRRKAPGNLSPTDPAFLPTGVPYLLSCGHVLAWTQAGSPSPGQFIEQPFDMFSNAEFLRVAQLTPQFTNFRNQTITADFAFARLMNIRFQNAPRPNGVSVRSSPASFPPGLQVQLRGRVSGAASGSVRGVQAAVRIPTQGHIGLPFGFWVYQNLVMYQVANAPGDSGAAVIESQTGAALGLHVAGNGSTGLMFPVRPIFDRFDMELAP